MREAWMKGRLFFFEKKNQKTFGLWRTGPGEQPRQRAKVFCFFSSEKKTFLFCQNVTRAVKIHDRLYVGVCSPVLAYFGATAHCRPPPMMNLTRL
jgi:hypothetical protein